jgi:colanic acid/amylovoran biosynthesis glycosyltransferase
MQKVLIYNTEILPATQTFTLAQTNALRRFEGRYVGLGPARDSLPVPNGAVLLTHDHSLSSRLKRNAYKLVGYAPRFHEQLNQLRPVLLHVHFLENGAIGLPLLSQLRVPVVLTMHGSIECTPEHLLRRTKIGNCYLARRKRLIERTSLFLCVSKFIYVYLREGPGHWLSKEEAPHSLYWSRQ